MRLFVAIEFSSNVRSALAKVQSRLEASCGGVRWIPPRQIHLTVKFLGDVPDANVEAVSRALADATVDAEPFDMELVGCGCFPPKGSVRIVWTGVNEESGRLHRNVEAVEREMARLGYAKERRAYSPHVTIGRVRRDDSGGAIRSAAENCNLDAVGQPVSSMTLMSSVLSSKGPTYAPVVTTGFGRTNPRTS